MEQKRIYEQPKTDVIEMKHEGALLTASGDIWSREYDAELED